jgi:hypothetical protein
MVNRLRLYCLIITFTVVLFGKAGAEESAALGTVQLKSSSSILQNLLLICDKNTLRYTLSGGGENGISSLELISGDKIINYTNCNGAKQCRLSGAIAIVELPSAIVTATVSGSDKREEKEKIKLTLQGDETKVYMVSSVPEMSLTSPVVITENKVDSKTPADSPASASGVTQEIAAGPIKGPVIETNVVQNSYNNFTLNITSKDVTGIDFLEILENGVFMDVQICDKKPICTLTKIIKNRKPGDYKYLIKSMNVKEGLSFQEEKISFSE